jgi:NADPH-dependent curcumin reductase CurA
MRGRMNDGRSYVPPFEIGKPLEGGAVGDVIESRAPEFQPGDVVTSNFGWREYFTASPQDLHRVNRDIQPLSAYLGILGMTGMTAWAGLNLVDVKAGDVIFISGAAGAVGNVAGQLAKLRGCRVIGSAGSAEKVRILRDECGFDRAFDYKAAPVLEQLNREAPDGIDVYFDNVGGETLEAALSVLRVHGRIVACGGISAPRPFKPVQHHHQTAHDEGPHRFRLAGSPSRVRSRGWGLFQGGQIEKPRNHGEGYRPCGGRFHRPLRRAKRRQDGRRAGLLPMSESVVWTCLSF